MRHAPLYRAVGEALRRLEREFQPSAGGMLLEPREEPVNSHRTIELPNYPATEQLLVGSFTFIAEGVRVLRHVQDHRVALATRSFP